MRTKINEIIYIPTVRCNLNCKHCGEEQHIKGQDEIDCKYVAESIINCQNIDTSNIAVSGGEPFLKEDFIDFIETIVLNTDLNINVTSNGYFTEKIEDVLKMLSMRGGIDRISFAISIDGNGSTHNKIRRSSDSYEHIIKTLDVFLRYGVRVNINTVVQKDNIDELDLIRGINDKTKTGEWHISYIPQALDISEQPSSAMYNTKFIDDIWSFLDNERDKMYVSMRGTHSIRRGFCRAGERNITIGADGKVYTCLTGAYYKGAGDDYCIGNLMGETLDGIWDSYRRKTIRNKVENCSGCSNPCELNRELSLENIADMMSEDEKRVFFSHEKCRILFGGGWHGVETDEHGASFRWMSERRAWMLLNTENGKSIKINCKTNIEDKIYANFIINGEIMASGMIGKEVIGIDIPMKENFEKLEIIIDKVWRPCDVMNTADERSLGIMVFVD